MARRISVTETPTAAATTYAVTLGAHQDGDILFVCLTQDGGAATAIAPNAAATTAGWAMIGTQAAFADSKQAWAYKVVGTGEAPVSNPTFTGANDYWIGTCIVVREADTAGTILWQRSDWGGTGAGIATGTSNSVAASSAGGTTVITAPTDALLLYSWSTDGGAYLRCKTDELIADSKVSNPRASHIIGHRQHGASGNPADVTVYSTELVEGGNGWVLAIPNATGGNLEKDCRSGINEVEWFGNFRIATGALCTITGSPSTAVITYTAPTTDRWLDGQGVSFTSTGSLPTGITANRPYYIVGANAGANTFNIANTLGGTALTISSAGSGTHTAQLSLTAPNDITATINGISTLGPSPALSDVLTVWVFVPPAAPWGSMNSISCGVSTAGAWAGFTRKIPSTDMAGKIVSFAWMIDMAPSAARAGAEGVIAVFGDGTNWSAYKVSPRDLYLQNALQTAFIDLDNGTTYDSSGSLNTAAVTHFALLFHRIGSSTGADAIYVKNLYVMGAAILTGGGEDFPVDFVTLSDAMNSWGSIDLASKQGSSQMLGNAKVQIGDGTNKMYFDSSGASFEYPIAFSTADMTAKDWNGTTDSVSLTIKAASGNTVNLAAGGITTSVPQSVTIDATSATSGISIAGQSFKGLSSFTDNAGVTLTGPTFKECGTVTLKANMTGMSVSKTVGAVPAVAMTANNKTIASSTIDLTGTGAAYHVALGAAVTAITMNGVTLTGTPGTDKIYSALASGTLTITVDGTGTSLSASDVTFVGGSSATASVVAPQPTLDATVLANTRVVLWNRTTSAELDNVWVTGTSWSKVITSGASSGDTLTLHVFKEGYEEFSTSFIYAGIDNTLLVSQSVHASVASLRTELGITDYTTITEFALDITGAVEIDADDADGSTTKARLAIWYNGVLTTENGARYLRGAISVLSTAAIRINTSVLDLKIENISVTYGLNFTDTERRLYRDDGAAIYAAASAAGSIQNDYSGVPDTVTTSDQSLNLATAEQAIDNKLSSISSGVWAYVVTGSTTAVQMMRGFAAMLLGKVSGAGTGAETFRDIADTKDVATFTVDSSGNRTAVTRDLT